MTEKKYSKDHEWISIENEIAIIGITNYAQECLGDIVFVELPKVGRLVEAGDQVGLVESVKAASDLFSPISGEIIEINNELIKSPQVINNDPENSGWYMKIKLNDIEESKKLMNFDEYKKIIT